MNIQELKDKIEDLGYTVQKISFGERRIQIRIEVSHSLSSQIYAIEYSENNGKSNFNVVGVSNKDDKFTSIKGVIKKLMVHAEYLGRTEQELDTVASSFLPHKHYRCEVQSYMKWHGFIGTIYVYANAPSKHSYPLIEFRVLRRDQQTEQGESTANYILEPTLSKGLVKIDSLEAKAWVDALNIPSKGIV